MKDQSKHHSCGFEETLVGFVYEEIGVTDKLSFEGHLAACESCSAEVLAFQELRQGLTDWSASAQLPARLANPAISAVKEDERVTMFDSVLRIFRLTPQFAAGFLLLATIIVAVILMAGRKDSETSVTELASNKRYDSLVADQIVEPQPTQSPAEAAVSANASEPRSAAATRPTRKRVKAVRGTRSTEKNPTEPPTLSDADDTEDDSLRLTDIFAELGVE